MYQYVPKKKIPNEPEGKGIMSAYSLMTRIEKDKKVKMVDFTVPFNDRICLYDLSINAHGMDEDKVYAAEAWYRTHIRRGNTVIQIFDDRDNVKETFYGRKGFEKFFDLAYEYILYNLKEIDDFQNFGIKDVDEHYQLHDIIFGKVRKSFQNNSKVVVYKLVKANGENAQVSWCSKLNGWLIASKNVALYARHEADVEKYKADRFGFAKLIAKEWFRHVKRIEAEGKLEALKKDMDGKTFVGEYCGNQDYQHLVKYTSVDIHFVAVVENESTITCLSPKEAFALFEKYGLTRVNYKEMGVYSDWQSLNRALKDIYLNVAETEIDVEEEGSVIYLVRRDEDGKEETLSLSKLKTLEYRLYRKLREKLRTYISQDGRKAPKKSWTFYYDKFVSESKELCTETKPPMPLDYYFRIGKAAFQFADRYPKDTHLIHDQYITFLSLLLYCLDQNFDLTPNSFQKELIDKVLPIPWCQYYKKYKEQNPTQNEQAPTSTSTQSGSKQASNIPKTYVIIPMGIPGMGKTYFVNLFKKHLEAMSMKIQFSSISSDEVRRECMDRLGRHKRNWSEEQLYDKTGKEAKDLFNSRLGQLLQSSSKRDCDAHFIFIDKNHPPNAIKGTFDLIKANSEGLDLSIVCLSPLIQNRLEYQDEDKTFFYPFSKNLFFTCFDRVQKRVIHETLKGSGPKSAGVLVMFLQFFRNVKLNTESVLKNGFDKHMVIPFSVEDDSINIPDELFNKLVEALKKTKPQEQCSDDRLIQDLNTIYERSKIQIKNPEASYIEEHIKKFLQEQVLPELRERKSGARQDKIEPEESKKEEAPTRYVYNPGKVPTYLGIFALDDSPKQVCRYVERGLELLAQKYKDDKQLIKCHEDMKAGNIPFDLIKDLHVTTLFIGGNKNATQSEFYTSFVEGINMNLEIVALAIVPGKIVTGICYPDQSTIKISNKFPHVTLMKGDRKSTRLNSSH